MPRERREFKRTGFKRKYKKLFVIATEGEKTEIKYLQELADSDYVNNNLTYIEILPTRDGKSSPKNVISRLDKFRNEYSLYDSD